MINCPYLNIYEHILYYLPQLYQWMKPQYKKCNCTNKNLFSREGRTVMANQLVRHIIYTFKIHGYITPHSGQHKLIKHSELFPHTGRKTITVIAHSLENMFICFNNIITISTHVTCMSKSLEDISFHFQTKTDMYVLMNVSHL